MGPGLVTISSNSRTRDLTLERVKGREEPCISSATSASARPSVRSPPPFCLIETYRRWPFGGLSEAMLGVRCGGKAQLVWREQAEEDARCQVVNLNQSPESMAGASVALLVSG